MQVLLEANPDAPNVLLSASPSRERSKLINIDNGGTLTDICVIDGPVVYRTKTLTTPHDLSQCLFDGLKKASHAVYGSEDLTALLLSTSAIRYSTTQGTNALVERKGPRLGLIFGGDLSVESMKSADGAGAVFASLVNDRVSKIDITLDTEALEHDLIRTVGGLASSGANRLVISVGGANGRQVEAQFKRRLLRTFPPHLLGALPILYASELVDDSDDARRTWTALFNAFLHPAMERFLYSAEHKLRDAHAQNPLLVFRNDGNSGRVAKTIAVKTYSSGPRGGMEGARALARHYQFPRLLTMDIGGTTTDIGLVEGEQVRAKRRGHIEGIETSFALCDVVSAGVGGSSIIEVMDGRIKVGPESVGSVPGPACFGLGGTSATITDAFLLSGLLDPSSFFGGELKIDFDRARTAVVARIAQPLGLNEETAANAMEAAWVSKVADNLRAFTQIDESTTLAAFGGAGPFVACRVADAVGIKRVLIPGLAAVFSAFGIGFSDVGHSFSEPLRVRDESGLREAKQRLLERATRAMFGEDADIERCDLEYGLDVSADGISREVPLSGNALPANLPPDAVLCVTLTAIKPMTHAVMNGQFGVDVSKAISQSTRETLVAGARRAIPLYVVEQQRPGASAAGPAVLEEAFFTCRIDAGWTFEINAVGDILLNRTEEAAK